MALLAGQRNMTKKIATEIMGSKDSNARIPVLMIFILVFEWVVVERIS